MEEIIYLVVVVGWFLLNAYKKSQAKKQQEAEQTNRRQPQEEYAPEEPSTMEDLLRQLMGEEERVPEPVPVPASTPKPFLAPQAAREPLTRKPVHQKPTAVRASRLTPRTPVRRENSRTKQPSVPMETEDMNPHTDARFNLRNAIVYSAILQRPYA